MQIGAGARILIASQAPGRIAHRSGTPFADRSGAALRLWLGIDALTFYDPERIAILPQGLCYPGVKEVRKELRESVREVVDSSVLISAFLRPRPTARRPFRC